MKTNSRTAKALTVSRAVMTALLIGSVFALTPTMAAQQPAPEPNSPQGEAMGQMMKGHGAMMAEHQKMMADMKAMGQRLSELVAKMNDTQGADKIDAVVAVVNEIVAQQARVRDRMMQMHDGMMDHMMSMMKMPETAHTDVDSDTHHQKKD